MVLKNLIKKKNYLLAILRISLGWIFLWAFIDKLFGLGFSTISEKAWILGGSPTYDYLMFATKGPFVEIFQSIAGNILIDWIFMIALLLIGVFLILGIGMRVACYSGILMMILIWFTELPPQHNPFIDHYLICVLVLMLLYLSNAGHWFGLGDWWDKTKLVREYPLLK